MTSNRYFQTLLSAALALCPLGGVGATHARAATPQYLLCRFSGTFSVSPGMTLTPSTQQFRSEITFSDCQSSDPAITSGQGTTSGTATGSCVVTSGTAEQRVRWNTGRRSTFTGSFVNVLVLEPVKEFGVHGEFKGLEGGNVNVSYASPQEGSRCLTDGLRQAAFTGVFVLGQAPASLIRGL